MKDLHGIILKPVITERSTNLRAMSNKYVFEVDPKANKREIKAAIEKLFNVTVKDIKTAIIRGKVKTVFMRGGRFSGMKPNRKKAIVTLAKGDNIEIFDQV